MSTPGKLAQFQWTDRDPFQCSDFVADPSQHPANFTIATFGQNNFQPTAPFGPFQKFGFRRAGQSLGDMNPLFKFAEINCLGNADDLDVVFLFNAESRMGQLIGQIAIIGDQYQTFAGLIESTDIVNSLVGFDQVDHARPTRRIFARGQDARRLVQHKVLKSLHNQRLRIDVDFLSIRIDFDPQGGNNLPVDFNSTLLDDELAFPTAPNSGRRHHALKSL